MADLVIRGMEMPTNVYDCPLNTFGFCNLAHDSNHIYCIGDSRPEWCPLVPLPEGHGDLIDRDAFRAENGLNAKCEHCPRNTYKCQNDMIHTKMEFCEMLDDAPVIVPAEGGGDNV